MRVGSLFSGIGGFDLAAEWMGWRTIWFSEIDHYCCALLTERFPGVPNLGDITRIDWSGVAVPDILCGGFPCQPHSTAGTRQGEDDSRYLWPEFARAIRALRPAYVVVENVPAIIADGTLRRVLGDLAGSGYDAEWSVISACAVGASHVRRRVFALAYPNGLNGRPGVRHPASRPNGTLQTEHRAARARASWNARLANPSALYRDADGIPFGMERNRAIGNAIVPQCAVEGPFRRIQELEMTRVTPGERPHE